MELPFPQELGDHIWKTEKLTTQFRQQAPYVRQAEYFHPFKRFNQQMNQICTLLEMHSQL